MNDRKRCKVAFALPARQFLWSVELPAGATVAQLLEQARLQARAAGEEAAIPWDSDSLGIFGEACRRADVPRDGDRLEIYRPLLNDPRVSRRTRTRGR